MSRLLHLKNLNSFGKKNYLMNYNGVDIINTDKVVECRNYFLNDKTNKTTAGN